MDMSSSPGACLPNTDAAVPAFAHASPATNDNVARLEYIDVGESACPSSSEHSGSTDVSFPSAVEHLFQGHYGNLCWRCGPYAVPPLKAVPVFLGNRNDQERWQSAGLLSTDIRAYENVMWLCLVCRNAFSRFDTRMFIVPTFFEFFKQAELMSHASHEPRKAPTAAQYAEYCRAQCPDHSPPLEWGLYTVYTVLGPFGSESWVADCLQWSGDPMAIVARMRGTLDMPISLDQLSCEIGELVDLYWEGGRLTQERTSTAATDPPAEPDILILRTEATTLPHEIIHMNDMPPATTPISACFDSNGLDTTPGEDTQRPESPASAPRGVFDHLCHTNGASMSVAEKMEQWRLANVEAVENPTDTTMGTQLPPSP